MGEIKFRGKRTDNGKWVFGYYVCVAGQYHYIYTGKINLLGTTFEKYIVIPETVGQYTGKTEKNGIEICDGDIVRQDDSIVFGVVKFGEYSQPFNDANSKHIGFYIDWADVYRRDLGYWSEKCEVVGNVHDTPELLKEIEHKFMEQYQNN